MNYELDVGVLLSKYAAMVGYTIYAIQWYTGGMRYTIHVYNNNYFYILGV